MARVGKATNVAPNAAPATEILRLMIISASGSTGPEDWTVSIAAPAVMVPAKEVPLSTLVC
jgi:hypothetical protein